MKIQTTESQFPKIYTGSVITQVIEVINETWGNYTALTQDKLYLYSANQYHIQFFVL